MRKIEALALGLGLLTAVVFPAGSGDRLLEEVRGRLNALRPFRVEFTQQVFIDGVKETEEKGFILFSDAGTLRWEYTRPESKIFLLQNDRYQFYQPASRQLMRGKLDQQREKLLWQLLAADAPATGYICDEKRRTITIRSQTDDGAFDLTVLLGTDGLPARAEQADPSGVQQVFLFQRYRGGQRISPADFRLNLPAGTEIVDE